MSRFRIFLTSLFVFALLGCGGSDNDKAPADENSPEIEQENTEENDSEIQEPLEEQQEPQEQQEQPGGELASERRRALDNAKWAWDNSEIPNYTFVHSYLCDCEQEDEVEVSVEQSELQTLFSTGDGSSLLEGDYPAHFTIEQLFDVIEQAIEEDVAVLEVEYNLLNAFPERITIDVSDSVESDDFTLVVDEFVAMPRLKQGRQNELDIARQKWVQAGIESYVYTYNLGCFCMPQVMREVVVSVQEKSIVEAYYLDSGEYYEEDDYQYLMTIDGFFELIQNSIDSHHGRLNVTYDETNGYPLSIFIDPRNYMWDDERSHTISSFQ